MLKTRKRGNATLDEIKPPNLTRFTKNLAEFDGKFNPGLAQICRQSDRFFVSFALNFTPKSGKVKFIRTFLIGA